MQFYIPRDGINYGLFLGIENRLTKNGAINVHEESQEGEGNSPSCIVFSADSLLTAIHLVDLSLPPVLQNSTIAPKEKTWGSLPTAQKSSKILSAMQVGNSFILKGQIKGKDVDITVTFVDGDKTREYHPDFIGGGNWAAYPDWVDENNIIIEVGEVPEDTLEFFSHEIDELFSMLQGEEYLEAHEESNDKEGYRRKFTEKAEIMIKDAKIHSNISIPYNWAEIQLSHYSDGIYTVVLNRQSDNSVIEEEKFTSYEDAISYFKVLANAYPELNIEELQEKEVGSEFYPDDTEAYSSKKIQSATALYAYIVIFDYSLLKFFREKSDAIMQGKGTLYNMAKYGVTPDEGALILEMKPSLYKLLVSVIQEVKAESETRGTFFAESPEDGRKWGSIAFTELEKYSEDKKQKHYAAQESKQQEAEAYIYVIFPETGDYGIAHNVDDGTGYVEVEMEDGSSALGTFDLGTANSENFPESYIEDVSNELVGNDLAKYVLGLGLDKSFKDKLLFGILRGDYTSRQSVDNILRMGKGEQLTVGSRRILWSGRESSGADLGSSGNDPLRAKEDYLAKKRLNRKMEAYQDNDQHFVTDDMGEKVPTAKNFLTQSKQITSDHKEDVIESLMSMIISYYDGKADAGRYLDSLIDIYGPEDSYDSTEMRSALQKRNTDKFLNLVLDSVSLVDLEEFLDNNIVSKIAVGDIVLRKSEEITSAFKVGSKVALRINKALKGIVKWINDKKDNVINWFDGTQSVEPDIELIPAHLIINSSLFQRELENVVTELVEQGIDLSPWEIRKLVAEYFMSIQGFNQLADRYGLDSWERGVFKDTVKKLRKLGLESYSFEPASSSFSLVSAVGNAGAGAAEAMGTPGTGIDGTGKSVQTAPKPGNWHDLKLSSYDKKKKRPAQSGLLDMQTHSHNPISQKKINFDQWRDSLVYSCGKIADAKSYKDEILSEIKLIGSHTAIKKTPTGSHETYLVPGIFNDLDVELLNEYDESKFIKAHIRVNGSLTSEEMKLLKASLIMNWVETSKYIMSSWQVEEPLADTPELVLYYPLPNKQKNIDGISCSKGTQCYIDGHKGTIQNDLKDGRVVVSWDDGLWSVEKLVALSSSQVSHSDSYVKRYSLQDYAQGLASEIQTTSNIESAFKITSDSLDNKSFSYINKQSKENKAKSDNIKSGLLKFRI